MSLERLAKQIAELTVDERESLWSLLDRHGVDVVEDVWETSAKDAYDTAMREGGSDKLRRLASRKASFALMYAQDIDKSPHRVTRRGACKTAACAIAYAEAVDHSPRNDTREAASTDAMHALMYARNVDKGPHDATRTGACKDPYWANLYANEIDKAFREETLAAVKGSCYEGVVRLTLKLGEDK